jgi:hypothetical protein
MHEHWKSSEYMNEHSAFNKHPVDTNLAHEHGEKPTPRFTRHASPFVLRSR